MFAGTTIWAVLKEMVCQARADIAFCLLALLWPGISRNESFSQRSDKTQTGEQATVYPA